jgi:hypothetical protein
VHLTRTDDHSAAVDALADRVGLDAVWADLDRRLRRTVAPCLSLHRAWTWERHDRRDRLWWPQGISVADGRALVSWYSTDGGSRVSALDLAARRYRHVELVRATANGFEPLRTHAGGLAWHGTTLYVAATKAGLWVCDTDDVVRTPRGYVLPVRHRLAPADPFRFSFVGVDGEALVVGEYDNSTGTRRLGRGPADGPIEVHEAGVRRAQGVAHVDGRWYVTASNGSKGLGTVWSGPVGGLREHRYALPIGPEDLAYDAATDRLWTVTEHPGKRWIVGLKRRRFS